MGEHVRPNVSSLRGRVAALCTIESFFTWMFEHVLLEGASLFAGIVALSALESFLTRMREQVLPESGIIWTRKDALSATERLLTAMNQLVSFQVSGNHGWVIALVATVLPLFQCLLLHYQKNSFCWLEDRRITGDHLANFVQPEKVKVIVMQW